MMATLLLSRWAILAINAIIFFVLAISVDDITRLVWGGHELHSLEEIISGVCVILIGYGVVLEERHSLRAMLGAGHTLDLPNETAIDHFSHGAGLLMLVYGLLGEISVECVRIPDRLINTQGIERGVLLLATFFIVASLWVLLTFSYRLVFKGAAGHALTSSVPQAVAADEPAEARIGS
jgi:hypothetical protein